MFDIGWVNINLPFPLLTWSNLIKLYLIVCWPIGYIIIRKEDDIREDKGGAPPAWLCMITAFIWVCLAYVYYPLRWMHLFCTRPVKQKKIPDNVLD